MNYLPPRRHKPKSLPKKRTKPRRSSAIKCRAHTNWVSNPEIWQCLVVGKREECMGRLDPHHVITRGAGGGDEQVVPLCRRHHDICHDLKTDKFDALYGTDIAETARLLWAQSPHRRAWEQRNGK